MISHAFAFGKEIVVITDSDEVISAKTVTELKQKIDDKKETIDLNSVSTREALDRMLSVNSAENIQLTEEQMRRFRVRAGQEIFGTKIQEKK